eukprot:2626222-Rhodomonas_salina.1
MTLWTWALDLGPLTKTGFGGEVPPGTLACPVGIPTGVPVPAVGLLDILSHQCTATSTSTTTASSVLPLETSDPRGTWVLGYP